MPVVEKGGTADLHCGSGVYIVITEICIIRNEYEKPTMNVLLYVIHRTVEQHFGPMLQGEKVAL